MKKALKNPAGEVSTGHKTSLGQYLIGDIESLLAKGELSALKGKVQLLLTSPPFPLNHKKSYGNLKGDKYLHWIATLAPLFSELLTEDGSIVIELGNCWEPGRPVQSLLPLRALLEFVSSPEGNLRLIQEFICYNPSRLPTPAQWVTVNRLRAVDSYTHIWWMAKNDFPKSDNSKVLRPYSKAMQKLLERQAYNEGQRPSGHKISSEGFKQDRGGSIAHNVLELEALDFSREVRLPNAFSFSNTASNDFYSRRCQELGITPHPARMPGGLASFFIQFLTEENDLVFDPFGGSNTTGYQAELLGRRWLATDINKEFAEHSRLRFENPELAEARGK